MACKFYLNVDGNFDNSFSENALRIFLLQNGFSGDNISSEWFGYKYKMDISLSLVDKLERIKSRKKSSLSDVEGQEDSYEGHYISALSFIDSNAFNYLGKIRIPKKSDEDYIKYKTLELYAEEVENAEEKAKLFVKNWNIIGNDSRLMHVMLTAAFSHLQTQEEFENFIGSDTFKKLTKKLQGSVELSDGSTADILVLLHDTLALIQKHININMCLSGSKILTDINLEVPIANSDKTLVVHLDKVYIDKDGNINVFNFRVSSTKVDEWSDIKKTKYDYEMALIKLALVYSLGIDPNKISLYDIPIILNYSEDFKTIDSIDYLHKDNGLISYVIRDNKDALTDKVNYVKLFIKTPVQISRISTDVKKEVDDLCSILIPRGDIESEGIKISARTWIKENSRGDGCITSVTDPKSDYSWKIDFGNGVDPVYIKDPSPISKNEEILKEVEKHEDLLSKGALVVTSLLVNEILNNIRMGTCEFISGRGFRMNGAKLEVALSPYMKHEDVIDENTGQVIERNYKWKLLNETCPDLTECNMLVFLNLDTLQIDIIVPSLFHSNQKLSGMKYKLKNILAEYLMDMDSDVMPATYGNLQMFRAIGILNAIIPLLGDGILGNIKIISPHSKDSGLFRTLEYASKEFLKVIRGLKNNVPGFTFKNRLRDIKYVDPIESIIWLKNSILEGDEINTDNKNTINDLGFTAILDANTINEKITALTQLLDAIQLHLGGRSILEIVLAMNHNNPTVRAYAQLFYETALAINYFTGHTEIEVENISTAYRYIMPLYANPDANVRLVANLYSKALDETARLFNDMYNPAKNFILEFYRDCGYSSILASLIGNAAQQYNNMYRVDEHNNRLMLFKNPYEEGNGLQTHERKFLKRALYHFAKIRALRNGDMSFEKRYKSPESKELLQYILELGERYFWVPLLKASPSTRRLTGITELLLSISNEMRKVKNEGVKYFISKAEEYEGVLDKSQSAERADDISSMSLRNPFARTEDGDAARNTRNHLLNTHLTSFWETNIEYLLADYTEKHIITDQLNKVLFQAKCMLTQMHFLGTAEGHRDELEKSIKEIEDFLKLNVFNKSIMEDFSKAAMTMLAPARHLMSSMYIAGNIKSAFRDTFEGIWQNIGRTISHFQTDLTTKSVLMGYKAVVENAFKSDRQLNLMSELCLRYRLSNTDAARIAEKAKLSRGGIFNYENWLYSTLRGPDFLNRMTLFTAQCMQDGVWDAWEFNKENKLVYNWKKDKRFAVYASGDKTNSKYAELKGMYMSRIRMYNQEHAGSFDENHPELTYNDDLPEPYTQDEIKKFKMFSDGIYGAYDKSMRMKLENVALGQAFTVFSTWLNGHVAAWFRKPGFYKEYFEIKLKETEDGNKLFFDEQGNIVTELKNEDGSTTIVDDDGNEIPSQTVVPVYDKIPVKAQGILYTLGDSLHVLAESGSAKEWKKKVWNNKYNQENFKKAGWDLLFLALFMALFSSACLGGIHKDYVKNSNPDDLIANGLEEIMFNASSNSYDGFMGIGAVAKYVLSDTTPMAANAPVTLTKDLFKVVLGKQGLDAMMFRDIPLLRAFKNTEKKYYKAHNA